MSERFIGEDDLENADFAQEEPECTCERVDVDLYDSRDCLVHGPESDLARRNREAEAEAEAAFWRGMPEF